MKKLTILLFACLVCAGAGAQINLIQENGTYKVGAAYLQAFDKPIVLQSGDVISVEADSFFLVNPLRMAFYRRIHKMIMDENQFTMTGDVIRLYEQNLMEQEKAFQTWYDYQDAFGIMMQNYMNASEKSLAVSSDNYLKLEAIALQLEQKVTQFESDTRKERKHLSFWSNFGKTTWKIVLGAVAGAYLVNRL